LPPDRANEGGCRNFGCRSSRKWCGRFGCEAGFGTTLCGYEILDVRARICGKVRTVQPALEVRSMAEDKLREKLADYVEDAHAMEQNDLKMIDSMISTTDDPDVKQMLEEHKRETEEHERRLRERLDAMGRGTSARKQAQAVGAALLKGVGDVARGDKAGKNARDGYTAEHLEIAAYQLLERLAEKAGDTETAEVARRNRADEEQMAERIDQSWDRTLELTLEENDIRV
jgi:ferritin-like metal-binding protein YciE